MLLSDMPTVVLVVNPFCAIIDQLDLHHSKHLALLYTKVDMNLHRKIVGIQEFETGMIVPLMSRPLSREKKRELHWRLGDTPEKKQAELMKL